MSSLVAEVRDLRTSLSALEPGLFSGEDCLSLVRELASLGKACDAARARLGARAASCGAHRDAGYLDAGDWLAAETGTSSNEAKRQLETAALVEECPQTRVALLGGEVSLVQAAEIVRTEAACPGSEAELLATARRAPLRVLQEEARKRRLEATDIRVLAARQRSARHFRHWRDELGMVRVAGALTPEAGVGFLSRLDAQARRIRKQARTEGSDEPWEAHAADALVELTEGKGRATSADVVLVCDIGAYRRGHALPGEPCQVVGGGPVPVSAVREHLDGDAFLKVVLHDGIEIKTIKHFGRHIPAELRTALELGPPPSFDGKRCGCGCGKRYGLQFDHVDPIAHNGPTCLSNLNPRTMPEHIEKTRQDRKAGLFSGQRINRDGRDPP